MAKETQKAKIIRLEQEVEYYKTLVDKADEAFGYSLSYKQMLKRIEVLERNNNALKDLLLHEEKKVTDLRRVIDELNAKVKEQELEVKVLQASELIPKVKNSRGAGRKPLFTEREKELIKMYRLQGKSYSDIAITFNCSVGLIHKLINE